MKRHRLPVYLLWCGVLFMACEKENTDATYGVRYQITTSNPSSLLGTFPAGINSNTERTATTVSWTSGSAVARRIRFEGTGDNEVDIRIDVPQNITLIGPSTTLGELYIPVGDYQDARFTIELSRTDPFVLTGNVDGTPIVLQVPPPLSFEMDRSTLSVLASTNYDATTTLNLSRVLNGITADMLADAALTNGQILISPTSNQRIYNLMLANMKTLGELEFVQR